MGKKKKLVKDVFWNTKAMSWCFKNKIKIFPHPLISDGSTMTIIISENGNEMMVEGKYEPSNIYPKINELYKKIYNEKILKTKNKTA